MLSRKTTMTKSTKCSRSRHLPQSRRMDGIHSFGQVVTVMKTLCACSLSITLKHLMLIWHKTTTVRTRILMMMATMILLLSQKMPKKWVGTLLFTGRVTRVNIRSFGFCLNISYQHSTSTCTETLQFIKQLLMNKVLKY